MEWSFFSGAIFGFLLALCVSMLIYLLTDTLDKANSDTLGEEEKTPLVIDRRLAQYAVKLLERDNRPAIEELVRQLKRALG
jgi:hypothetical protein